MGQRKRAYIISKFLSLTSVDGSQDLRCCSEDTELCDQEILKPFVSRRNNGEKFRASFKLVALET